MFILFEYVSYEKVMRFILAYHSYKRIGLSAIPNDSVSQFNSNNACYGLAMILLAPIKAKVQVTNFYTPLIEHSQKLAHF